MVGNAKLRLIAYYLPQYYPVPENDAWWGEGYTEWTAARGARPLFDGHYQPRLPAELGFYDLRDRQVRNRQAQLARTYGIEGFCYWHYWLGGGKTMLDYPLREVIKWGEPQFPFCVAWANHDWTAAIGGRPDRILMHQRYPGRRDYVRHFYHLLDVFRDNRYITVGDKRLFIVFRPRELPDPAGFVSLWSELARKEGLPGFYFVGIANHWKAEDFGFDASIEDQPSAMLYAFHKAKGIPAGEPLVYDYEQMIEYSPPAKAYSQDHFPCIVPGFDTTPRLGRAGVVLNSSSPELFEVHAKRAVEYIEHYPLEKRFVFIKSWNEWGEGNYLEPDQGFGKDYLEALARAC